MTTTHSKSTSWMLAIAIVSVIAVGVSTAKVVYALASYDEDLANKSGLLNAKVNIDADLVASLVTVLGSTESVLVLENITDDTLRINEFSETVSSWNISLPESQKTPIVLESHDTLTVRIQGPLHNTTKARTVSMKGRVIDGNVMLFTEPAAPIKKPNFLIDKNPNRLSALLSN